MSIAEKYSDGLPVGAYSDEEVKALAADFFRYVHEQYPRVDVGVFVEGGGGG